MLFVFDQPIRGGAVHVVSSQQTFSEVVTILCPTPLFLVGTGNFMNDSGVNQGNLPHRKLRPFLERVREMECPISFLGSNGRYRPI